MEAASRQIVSPIETYTHQEYGNRVDLVGAIHVGEAAYYEQLQTYLDERAANGAHVHYEKVRRAQPAEIAASTYHVRSNIYCTRAMMRSLYGSLGGLDLVTQKEGITYRDEWENHDITELDQARRIRKRTLGGFALVAGLSRTVTRLLPLEERKKLILDTLHDATDLSDRQKTARILGPLERDKNKTVIHYRNQVALGAMDSQLEADATSDLALFWGMGHMAGLSAGLRDRGFIKTAEQQLVAIHITDV